MTPGNAIEYVPPGAAERKAFEKLRTMGIIRQTSPASYWFDLDNMGQEHGKGRNPKLPIIVALSIILAAAVIWFAP